jgi:hypothetical protein
MRAADRGNVGRLASHPGDCGRLIVLTHFGMRGEAEQPGRARLACQLITPFDLRDDLVLGQEVRV